MTAFISDAGIPMLFWQMPVAVMALLPVVVIESLIAWPILKQRFLPVLVKVFTANAISTFVGIPLAWAGMVIVGLLTAGGTIHGFRTPMDAFQSIVLQAAWLCPYEGLLYWLIPAATLVLLIPYFFISVFVERWWVKRRSPEISFARVSAAAWIGNIVTYGAIGIYTFMLLHRGLNGQVVGR